MNAQKRQIKSTRTKKKPANKEVTVWIVSPIGYIHAHAFDEVAEALVFSLSQQGYCARIVRNPSLCSEITIVLGANLLPSFNIDRLPKNFIILNLEQVDPTSSWMDTKYLRLLSKSQVWDYSSQNIKRLEAEGIQGVKKCNIGYAPTLSRIDQNRPKDIDVLFFGSINERRQKILVNLRDENLNVQHLFGVYGPQRDEFIARSKVVLNLHYYDAGVFEIVRVFYLLSNSKCVVSEIGGDGDLEKPFCNGVAFASYESLVEECKLLVGDTAARSAQETAGFEVMCNIPFSLPSQVASKRAGLK